jgi:membrane protein implicated in regulation of membrane protease activity
MNLFQYVILQASTPELPPAVSWILITTLGFFFVWFLNRSVTKMDATIDKMEKRMEASIEKLDSTMRSISDQLLKMDNRVTRLEDKAKGRRP